MHAETFENPETEYIVLTHGMTSTSGDEIKKLKGISNLFLLKYELYTLLKLYLFLQRILT